MGELGAAGVGEGVEVAGLLEAGLEGVGKGGEEVVAGGAFDGVDGYGSFLHAAFYVAVGHYEADGPGFADIGGEDYFKEALRHGYAGLS